MLNVQFYIALYKCSAAVIVLSSVVYSHKHRVEYSTVGSCIQLVLDKIPLKVPNTINCINWAL